MNAKEILEITNKILIKAETDLDDLKRNYNIDKTIPILSYQSGYTEGIRTVLYALFDKLKDEVLK